MKALEILKEIRNIETEYDHRKEHRFDEAIKELEVIQDIILEKDEALDIERLLFKNKLESLENRNCENCKHLKITNSEWGYNGCNHQDIYDCYDDGSYVIPKDFSCNRWKSKC